MALPATSITLEPKTYDDLLTTPDDGKRYEIICGEIVVSSTPPLIHQYVLGQLAYRFHNHLMTKELGLPLIGPYDVKLSHHNVVAPDLIAVHRKRLKIITELNAEGPPDVIVEVLAPETRQRDLVTKAAIYADFGVIEYWVVDQETECILVNALQNGRYSVLPNHGGFARSDAFPGLRIRISDIFALPDWWAAKISKEME